MTRRCAGSGRSTPALTVRGLVSLGLVAVLSTVLAACGESSTSDSGGGGAASVPATFAARTGVDRTPPVDGGTMAVGVVDELPTLDPASARYTPATLLAAKAVFDPLAAVTADGRAVPYLAAGLKPEDDFRTWRIDLRPGVVFHDATPLDPAALVTSFERLRQSPLTGQAFVTVRGIEVDGSQVVLRMTDPWASFPSLLTGQLGMVASPAPDELGRVRIGTGPFRITSWDPTTMVVARNTGYWRTGLPHLAEVTFRALADDQSRAAALAAGDVDLIQSGDPAQVASLLSSQPDRVLNDQLSSDKATILLNTGAGDLQDRELRRALAQALDRQAVVDQFGSGLLRISAGPGGPGWGSIGTYPPFDLAGAQVAVEAFQRVKGRAPTVTITTIPGSPTFLELAQFVQQQWVAAGVQVEIQQLDPTALTAAVATGRYEALLVAYWADDDPDAFRHFFHSDSYRPIPEISLDLTRFRSAVIDEAFDAGRATADRATRQAAYQPAWDEIGREVPMIFLFDNNWVLAWGPAVRNLGDPTSPEGEALQPNRWGSAFLTEVWRA